VKPANCKVSGVAPGLRVTGPVTAIHERPFDDLLREAVAFHGHLCPGQVLGARMTVAACRTLGFDHPQQAGKRLVVLVEIDRCLTDAIQALTGVSLGKRTLNHVDHGKAAATFVDTVTGAAVRVAVREEARELARFLAPTEPDPRRAQTAAYARLAEAKLLKLERVAVDPSWFARRRLRVRCEACGEGVNYEREVRVEGRTLCRGCAGDRYYTVLDREDAAARTPVWPLAAGVAHDGSIANGCAR
jgi:formylmethanofuran dehydrogenase subunit E